MKAVALLAICKHSHQCVYVCDRLDRRHGWSDGLHWETTGRAASDDGRDIGRCLPSELGAQRRIQPTTDLLYVDSALLHRHPTGGRGDLSSYDIHLFVCLSVCHQHRCITCIRHRVPLLVMMQQFLASAGSLSPWYTGLDTFIHTCQCTMCSGNTQNWRGFW